MARSTVLTTRRLRLRQWRRDDAKAYARHCNTPAVMEWLGGVMSPRQVMLEIEYFRRQQQRNGFTFWVLERKSDKALVGFCGLVRITERSTDLYGAVEIGWRIRSDLWRRGYAFEAATQVLRHAFAGLGLGRVVSRVAEGNEASAALMRKLGMQRNPKLEYVHPGDRTRLRVYEIDVARWRAGNKESWTNRA